MVHLYAGKKPNEEINFLDRQGFDVLELDVERGKSQDVCDPLVWRALEWAARNWKDCSCDWWAASKHVYVEEEYVPGS